MFSSLTDKIDGVLKKLRGAGVLKEQDVVQALKEVRLALLEACLLYTSPSPRDRTRSRMPSSA